MSNLNIKPSTIYCHDNIDILQGINSDCIDLIYLDPPFNKKKSFTAPTGTTAEGASFNDIFALEDIKEEWLQSIKEDNTSLYELLDFSRKSEGHTSYDFCYLAYMAIRLMEMHRILKDTGSIYLHCDQTMSHYLKLLLDCIFGRDNFRNEIVWCYTGPGHSRLDFPRKHDIILRFSKGKERVFNIDNIRIPYKDLHSDSGKGAKIWGESGKLQDKKTRMEYLNRGKIPEDFWTDIPSGGHISPKERTGYPTQKPLKLLKRIIEASSNENDIVLDPFCGCATTCIAAESLQRKWVGIDISITAYNLVKDRLNKEVPVNLLRSEPNFETTPPRRTDIGEGHGARKKYVYIISHEKYKGEYKVGIATDPKQRLNSYQTGDPDRAYRMEFKYLTPYYREIEAYIHAKFSNKYEWVKADLNSIKNEIRNWDPSISFVGRTLEDE